MTDIAWVFNVAGIPVDPDASKWIVSNL